MHRVFTTSLAACLLAAVATLAIAGDLTPPAGPPAPTMKPLNEVEPRIAINDINTPGDADCVHLISQPGSYYFTGNITGVVGKAGIEITASNVTIDLCGYTFSGVLGAGAGIFDTGTLTDVTIRNGNIVSWGGPGIALGTTTGVRVADISVRNCNNGGIDLATSAVITNCIATGNTGNGISALTGATISDCVANQNGADGISAGGGSVVSRCSAGANTVNGIQVLASSVVADCSAYSNVQHGINLGSSGGRAHGCSVFGNLQHGILTGAACAVENCSARSNTLDGIRVTDDCVVRNNLCTVNGSGGDGAGIIATGFDNRIEGNTCADADRGIQTLNGGNFITRNTCSGNTSNWNITVGNICLVVAASTAPAFSGNSGGTAPGSTDPNANFSY